MENCSFWQKYEWPSLGATVNSSCNIEPYFDNSMMLSLCKEVIKDSLKNVGL